MKKLKQMSLFLALALFCVPLQMFADFCECGEHSSGITMYQVGAEEGCCSGEASGTATITYFELNEGVWKAVGQKEITAQSAQNSCCESV